MPHMAGSSLVMFTHCISVVRHLIVISALWVHMFHVGVYVIVVVIFQCVYLILICLCILSIDLSIIDFTDLFFKQILYLTSFGGSEIAIHGSTQDIGVYRLYMVLISCI